MELEGSLKAFSLPEILQFLAMGKMTGTLMLRRDRQAVDLLIHQGRVVNSATSDQTRRLGQTLIQRRLLRRSDLSDVLREQQTTHADKMLGQLLVDRELISMDNLREVIRRQLEEEIWELFSWETGEFRFEHRSDSEIQNILVEVEIEPLIIEGTRRSDEWKAIIHNLRGDSTVLTLSPWKPQEHADLTFTPTEWQVLAYLNGFFSIGSIVTRIGIGRFETYRILNTFLNVGIVSIKEDRSTVSARPARPASMEKQVEAPRPGRRLGLFGRKRVSDAIPTFERNEKFASPIGLVARFIDLVARTCLEHRDFNAAPGDDSFLERVWRPIVMDCPLADLIQFEGNRLDASALERYLELGGLVNATLRIYEDAIEALSRLYGTMASEFAQRMGERSYQRLVATLKTEWLPGVHVEQPYRFDFESFLSRSLLLVQGER